MAVVLMSAEKKRSVRGGVCCLETGRRASADRARRSQRVAVAALRTLSSGARRARCDLRDEHPQPQTLVVSVGGDRNPGGGRVDTSEASSAEKVFAGSCVPEGGGSQTDRVLEWISFTTHRYCADCALPWVSLP